ncbi:tautomerase family protein [Catenuloplanes atrovinosus]|uniref:Phenylpyruvate tautomerase PptA (4-oxalocrotonate tautomerase family) n=1 Tax=Catenuloplanes atrovinosus TaxID=137266 RepID=A0AAE3YPQ6_9ACTN|nr:tautomerase family protein [Catenuloplanes atrovinosus]MDR7277415.1 phenylpyruvate tautomerase PptA (4-oxalocrotonate tautomerase family) [Catenuloplanes atrovinosus]
MPHLSVDVLESDLAGRESALIARLTDAVAEVYGPWARDIAVVRLNGVPAGRWGIGGVPATAPAPAVTFGIKEAAFGRPEMIAALASGVTDAIAGVLGDHVRDGVTIDFIGSREGRSASGGKIQ